MITGRFNENFRYEDDLPSGQYERESNAEREARLELAAKVHGTDEDDSE